jgi:hypothetical protein
VASTKFFVPVLSMSSNCDASRCGAGGYVRP